MNNNTVSRRAFLYLTGAAAVTALPATSAAQRIRWEKAEPANARPLAPEATNIVMMTNGELSDAEIAQFNADYAPITLTRIDLDLALYRAMYAAGNPPDLARVTAPDIPQMLAHKMPLNLQPYFEASTVLQLADLESVNDYYRATLPDGDLYGMVKWWRPDNCLWVNEKVFEVAGATPPNPASMPLNENALAALCRAATTGVPGSYLTTGLGVLPAFIDRYWMVLAKAAGGNLFSDNFSRANIVGNPVAVAAISYLYDLAADGAVQGPLNPSLAWCGADFVAGKLAMVWVGYWFHGFAIGQSYAPFQQAIADGKIKMYPNITWKGARYDPSVEANGAIVSAPTSHPAEAWTVFEWYMGKEPAHARAATGWGLPALKSLYSLVPKTGPLSAQAWATVQAELPFAADPLRFNPFLADGEPMVPGQVFLANWGAALNGDITFDELLAMIESQTNAAIREEMPKAYLPLAMRP